MAEATAERQTALLWDYIRGFHAVHLMNTGVRLGLFERLAGTAEGMTAAALAADLDLHPPYVEVWCRTACAWGLVDAEGGGAYRLAPFFDLLLANAGNPRYLAPYVTCSVDHYGPDMERYSEYFRTGGVYRFQDHGEAFSRAVAATTAGFHTVVARRLLPSIPGMKEKLAAGARVLDMGCGAGGLLIRIAEAHPAAACLGVDVDAHGVALARRAIERAGLAGRVAVALNDGDAMDHADSFDLVTLFEVLHEIPAAARFKVLANCHRALRPGGALFILDETYPSTAADLRKPEYGLAVQTAFNELIWGNVVPTREEQDELLAAAGFTDIRRQIIADLFTAITAVK